MLIRLVVENFMSFNERREFNMLPQPRYRKLEHHVYHEDDVELLKMAAIYGANASGKSNLVKAMQLIAGVAGNEKLPENLQLCKFRFDSNCASKPITIGIEFIHQEDAYFYTIQFGSG